MNVGTNSENIEILVEGWRDKHLLGIEVITESGSITLDADINTREMAKLIFTIVDAALMTNDFSIQPFYECI